MADLWTQVEPGVTARRKIGLVGAAVSDHPAIRDLCRKILAAGGTMGISSLRADSADAELLHLLAQGGVRSVALAPEAGSDRLRRVINKGLTRDDLARAAVDVSQAGIRQLRLYFMVGLPTETLDDVAEIPRLAKFLEHSVIKASQGKQHLGLITLSLSSFVPKPFTPFQWTPFLEVAELKKRLKLVAREFHGVKNVRVHTDLPKWAYVQALLARGDRRVADMLLAAQEHGWNKAFRTSPINPDFFTLRERRADELFPWDFIDHGISKKLPLGRIPAGPGRQRNPALLETGDVLRSKSLSKAQITLVDDSVITLSPQSRLAIDEFVYNASQKKRQAVIEIFQGLAHVLVNKLFKVGEPDFVVKTHTAVTGVRGTDFGIRLQANSTTILNFSGVTQVANIFPEVGGLERKIHHVAFSFGPPGSSNSVILKDMQGTSVAFGLPPTLPFAVTGEDMKMFMQQLGGPLASSQQGQDSGTVARFRPHLPF